MPTLAHTRGPKWGISSTITILQVVEETPDLGRDWLIGGEGVRVRVNVGWLVSPSRMGVEANENKRTQPNTTPNAHPNPDEGANGEFPQSSLLLLYLYGCQ